MISYERAYEVFRYDPETGKLFWKVALRLGYVNREAGCLNKGYVIVKVDGELIHAHRIIFLMHHGWVPEFLDHINRRRPDNRIENLRPANGTQNQGNSVPPCNNTSGFKGVSKQAESGKWHAQIKIKGKQTYLGRCDTPEEAARLYDTAAIKHFGEFAWLNFPSQYQDLV